MKSWSGGYTTVDKKYFKKSKNSEKNEIMIWGIHYFITKLKTKIDVILRSRFKKTFPHLKHSAETKLWSNVGLMLGLAQH